MCLKVKDNMTFLDLLKLQPTDEAFLLTYLEVKGREALMPEPLQGSELKRGRKRGHRSLSDNTSLYIAQLKEVIQRRTCLREEDQNDLNNWYKAAFTHAKEGAKTIVDARDDNEEDANMREAADGANRRKERPGKISLADVMGELGVGEWTGV